MIRLRSPLIAAAVFALWPAAPPARAAEYLPGAPAGCYRTHWQSKMPLFSALACAPGHSMRSISFSHAVHQNQTHQEYFQLLCCQPSWNTVKADACRWGPWISNWALSTHAPAPADSLLTGIEFWHDYGRNFTHEQWFRVRSCSLERPKLGYGTCGQNGSKWSLTTEFGCQYSCASPSWPYHVVPAEMSSIGFSHQPGQNGTHEENVYAGCNSY